MPWGGKKRAWSPTSPQMGHRDSEWHCPRPQRSRHLLRSTHASSSELSPSYLSYQVCKHREHYFSQNPLFTSIFTKHTIFVDPSVHIILHLFTGYLIKWPNSLTNQLAYRLKTSWLPPGLQKGCGYGCDQAATGQRAQAWYVASQRRDS